MTDFFPVILNQAPNRKHYTDEFKRQIVEASLVAGTSISGLALKHGINTNLVHKWRSRYRHGAYGIVSASSTLASTQIVSHARSVAANTSHITNISADTQSPDCIELFFNRTRVLAMRLPKKHHLHLQIERLTRLGDGAAALAASNALDAVKAGNTPQLDENGLQVLDANGNNTSENPANQVGGINISLSIGTSKASSKARTNPAAPVSALALVSVAMPVLALLPVSAVAKAKPTATVPLGQKPRFRAAIMPATLSPLTAALTPTSKVQSFKAIRSLPMWAPAVLVISI